MLAQLQCLGIFLSTAGWQDQNTSCLAAIAFAISKNLKTRDPDDRGVTLCFLKSPSSNHPGFNLSVRIYICPIAYTDQICPSRMWSWSVSSTQPVRVSQAVLCHRHTHNLHPLTGHPSTQENRCLQVGFGSSLAATISIGWCRYDSHNHSTNHTVFYLCVSMQKEANDILGKKKKGTHT